MTPNLDGWHTAGALLLASVGTYVCRAGGVLLSGHINQDSEIFKWLSAVTYSMIAALTVRLILMPTGALATVPVTIRILIGVVSLGVMLIKPGGRLVPALLTGTGLMLVYGLLR